MKKSHPTPTRKSKKSTGKSEARNRNAIWRINQIDAMLRAEKFPNASYLAEKFETSRCTIWRDAEFMRDRLNLPIEYSQARGGYHYTHTPPPLPSLQFTEADLFGFCVIDQMLSLFRGTQLEPQLRSTFQKLSSGLTEQLSVSWDAVAEAISFRATSTPMPVDPEVLDTARRVVMEHEIVEFFYHGLDDDQPELRRVEPFHLLVRDGLWYLFAYDPESQECRKFVLLRLTRLRATGEHFEPGERHVHPDIRLQHSIGVFGGDKPERVRLRLNKLGARLLSERSYHPTQKITRGPDGQHELTMHVLITPELEHWVMSYLSEVQVLEPATLRKRIQEQAREILAWPEV